MGAILNGMARHGGVIPYGATFFIFTDYMRPSIRLAALMGCRVVYVLTHDSVGLGEDGPTHQPIEHLASLRAMPNMHVVRPADANETAVAWRMALERTAGPTALVLSRQKIPVLPPSSVFRDDGVGSRSLRAGGRGDGRPDVLLIASGSEVSVCAGGEKAAGGRGSAGARGEHAVLGAVRGAGGGVPGRGASRRRFPRASPWRRGRPSAGNGTWETAARRSGSTGSALPHRPSGSSVNWGSRRRRCATARSRSSPRSGEESGHEDESVGCVGTGRPESLARLHPPRHDRVGRACPTDRGRRHQGRHLQPDDLREGGRDRPPIR